MISGTSTRVLNNQDIKFPKKVDCSIKVNVLFETRAYNNIVH